MRCVPSDDRLPWNLLEWVLPVKRAINLQITALRCPPTPKSREQDLVATSSTRERERREGLGDYPHPA